MVYEWFINWTVCHVLFMNKLIVRSSAVRFQVFVPLPELESVAVT